MQLSSRRSLMRVSLIRSLPTLLAVFAVACGGGGASESRQPTATGGGEAANPSNVSLDKSSYPVFPDADKGADPSVPAEHGGAGFKGDGWETNTNYDLIGDPRATKGGRIRDHIPDFPAT